MTRYFSDSIVATPSGGGSIASSHTLRKLLMAPTFSRIKVQWVTECQASLVFEWPKVVRLPNGPVFECNLNTRLNLVQQLD